MINLISNTKLIIKKNDYFLTGDNMMFITIEINDKGITGKSLEESAGWLLGEEDDWSLYGMYSPGNESIFDIKKVFTKEEYPEYFL